MTIYSTPAKHNLEVVGEIDWLGESYEFDLTVVFRDTITGALLFGDNAGCSCPGEFEDVTRDHLTEIITPQVFISHVNHRLDRHKENPDARHDPTGQAGELVQKVRELLPRAPKLP